MPFWHVRKESIARPGFFLICVIGSPKMAVLATMSCSGIHSVSTRASSVRLSQGPPTRWLSVQHSKLICICIARSFLRNRYRPARFAKSNRISFLIGSGIAYILMKHANQCTVFTTVIAQLCVQYLYGTAVLYSCVKVRLCHGTAVLYIYVTTVRFSLQTKVPG